MAKTEKGIVKDNAAYEKILYVSQDRFEALIKKAKKESVTRAEVEEMMYPEDLEDDKVLVPVDMSGAGEDFPDSAEEIIAKVGPKGALDAVIAGAELFKKTSAKKFKKPDRPLPMSVGEWLCAMAMGEGDAEEGAEEEDGEVDEEVDPEEEEEEAEPPTKKPRKK
mmetsp:Transcript_70323/g.153215  ORF Transcript_70323/g.153215 Transcript_70323/m.153215 type:complete len:165 (-) Transcript_70323:208-702(-)|eukprot:CAMPEP_0194764520 /NCGR_PEP_ID=MMETSP0323_2-20130528/23206_1 /TAXON_ID=2866 ORGANISM="Crypthecodinium cohnii, Strain Seligo" /NCGR_SAMPLE_ID=MMETSP0323_2 /ASSEMBLY_ACC=CAM_ASM_000346 /LENGTH=164 /DNA_ID=CAMNT_0039691889 /DNA_START=70 /DNA_END=564 /DNA_ORIENTATION=+